MKPIEIARKFAAMGGTEDAVKSYQIALSQGCGPEERLEAAAYNLQYGGDYQVSYIHLYSCSTRVISGRTSCR